MPLPDPPVASGRARELASVAGAVGTIVAMVCLSGFAWSTIVAAGRAEQRTHAATAQVGRFDRASAALEGVQAAATTYVLEPSGGTARALETDRGRLSAAIASLQRPPRGPGGAVCGSASGARCRRSCRGYRPPSGRRRGRSRRERRRDREARGERSDRRDARTDPAGGHGVHRDGRGEHDGVPAGECPPERRGSHHRRAGSRGGARRAADDAPAAAARRGAPA